MSFSVAPSHGTPLRLCESSCKRSTVRRLVYIHNVLLFSSIRKYHEITAFTYFFYPQDVCTFVSVVKLRWWSILQCLLFMFYVQIKRKLVLSSSLRAPQNTGNCAGKGELHKYQLLFLFVLKYIMKEQKYKMHAPDNVNWIYIKLKSCREEYFHILVLFQ